MNPPVSLSSINLKKHPMADFFKGCLRYFFLKLKFNEIQKHVKCIHKLNIILKKVRCKQVIKSHLESAPMGHVRKGICHPLLQIPRSLREGQCRPGQVRSGQAERPEPSFHDVTRLFISSSRNRGSLMP